MQAAPSVDAGPDQSIVLPNDTVILDGTISDDGFGGLLIQIRESALANCRHNRIE